MFLEVASLCSKILLGSQLNRVRKNLRHTKNFIQSPFSSHTKSSPSSNSFSELMTSRNCFAHGVAWIVSFPSRFMQGYLSIRVCHKTAASTCWQDRSYSWICSVVLLAHLESRILSSPCNWHNSKLSMLLFLAHSRHCKEPPRQFILACFQRRELILCRAQVFWIGAFFLLPSLVLPAFSTVDVLLAPFLP